MSREQIAVHGIFKQQLLRFPSPSNERVGYPETLDTLCQAPLGEEKPNLQLTSGLVASHPRTADVRGKPCSIHRPAVAPGLTLQRCPECPQGHTRWRDSKVSRCLSQLRKDVPHWCPPGSVEETASKRWLVGKRNTSGQTPAVAAGTRQDPAHEKHS